jgi:hypothetical protein
MKKIFLSVSFVAFATITWYVISGFAEPASTTEALRQKIAALEKEIAVYKNEAPACDYKYFDNETDLRKFISLKLQLTTLTTALSQLIQQALQNAWYFSCKL